MALLHTFLLEKQLSFLVDIVNSFLQYRIQNFLCMFTFW